MKKLALEIDRLHSSLKDSQFEVTALQKEASGISVDETLSVVSIDLQLNNLDNWVPCSLLILIV